MNVDKNLLHDHVARRQLWLKVHLDGDDLSSPSQQELENERIALIDMLVGRVPEQLRQRVQSMRLVERLIKEICFTVTLAERIRARREVPSTSVHVDHRKGGMSPQQGLFWTSQVQELVTAWNDMVSITCPSPGEDPDLILATFAVRGFSPPTSRDHY